MRRKTFDAILTAGGLVLAVVLLVAGGLLTWGSSFVSDEVRTQLTAQKIFIPPAGPALEDPAIKPYLTKYAGQQLVNGDQAKAYADHFINVHIAKTSEGRTYAELGGAQTTLKAQIATAKTANDPSAAALEEQLTTLNQTRETVFKGETLRGMLLNAYAFGTMGKVAGIAAVGAFVGAGIMFLLTLLGMLHLRRTPAAAELHVPGWHPEAATL
jgi:hypothetical protein